MSGSSNGYSENLFTTTNTKLAAVLLTFGAKLRSHMPLEWVDEFPSKAAYLAFRRDPRRNSGKTQVSFNFEPVNFDLRSFATAFQDNNADDHFHDVVEQLGLDGEKRKELLAAHSNALANSCRQTLEHREFLIQLMRTVPERAKWNVVRGQTAGQQARFGKTASKETIASLLSNIT